MEIFIMGSKLYTCAMCKRKFRRKWNAFRHNTTIHSDLGKIVLDSTNLSGLPNSSKVAKNAHQNKFRKFKNFQPIRESLDYEDYLDDIILEEFNKIDSKIMKIIGQMIKPYLELEESLNYMDKNDKAIALTKAFSSSMLSYNPVKSLHEISEMYRANEGLKIIARYWSQANNITIQQAAASVENVIINSSLIHRINN